ncbi:MAG: sigma-70 family RNA polymerase sigma factor [Eggerthellaceae bacterium]|nr:sigma-70 family RNA polymerase sigma factor [Eggerthellaceae bacterium]
MEVDRYIREHGKRVYGLCRHLCGNAADADDLYQETWLRVMKGLAKLDPSLGFEPWITRICVNAYRSSLRRLSRRPALEPPGEKKEAALPRSIWSESPKHSRQTCSEVSWRRRLIHTAAFMATVPLSPRSTTPTTVC